MKKALIFFTMRAVQDLLCMLLSILVIWGINKWIYELNGLGFAALYVLIRVATDMYFTKIEFIITPEPATSGEGQTTTQP